MYVSRATAPYKVKGRSPLKGRIVFQVADARTVAAGDDTRTRVILSHLRRAVSEDSDPKYLFYQGFHKSAELYGQELAWLHEDAPQQAQTHGGILLTEGTFDVAKAAEAGQSGALKAAALIEQVGLKPQIFDWGASVARSSKGDVFIPPEAQDLAELSSEQLQWLRSRGWL